MGVLELLVLPMGVEHAGLHIGGLSADVVDGYAHDERLPAEQRQAIAAWQRATGAAGKQAHCLENEIAAAVEFTRPKVSRLE